MREYCLCLIGAVDVVVIDIVVVVVVVVDVIVGIVVNVVADIVVDVVVDVVVSTISFSTSLGLNFLGATTFGDNFLKLFFEDFFHKRG